MEPCRNRYQMDQGRGNITDKCQDSGIGYYGGNSPKASKMTTSALKKPPFTCKQLRPQELAKASLFTPPPRHLATLSPCKPCTRALDTSSSMPTFHTQSIPGWLMLPFFCCHNILTVAQPDSWGGKQYPIT